MITFKEYLTEAFNKPYPYKWNFKDDAMWVGNFTTKDSDYVKVYCKADSISDPKNWDVSFKIPNNQNPYGNTNNFDAYAVLSTIIAMIKDLISEKNPEIITFSGNKDQGKDKLYKMMLKKFRQDIQHMGYTIRMSNSAYTVYFRLMKDYL